MLSKRNRKPQLMAAVTLVPATAMESRRENHRRRVIGFCPTYSRANDVGDGKHAVAGSCMWPLVVIQEL